MAIDERARHRLHRRLEEVLGSQEAETLMRSLPHSPWDEFVTREYLDLRLEAMEQRLTANFRQEFVKQTRTMIFAVIGAVATVGGLLIAAVRLS